MSDLQQRPNDLAARTDDLDKENEARKRRDAGKDTAATLFQAFLS